MDKNKVLEMARESAKKYRLMVKKKYYVDKKGLLVDEKA